MFSSGFAFSTTKSARLPFASVPVVAVVLTGVGALVFANLVSAVPGRSAARTSTAIVLRAE